MPDPYPPSEFGGKTGANGFQPTPPHVPTADEKLRSVYTTGDDSLTRELEPEAFEGLLPLDEQIKKRKDQGLFVKGEEDVFKATQ